MSSDTGLKCLPFWFRVSPFHHTSFGVTPSPRPVPDHGRSQDAKKGVTSVLSLHRPVGT